MEINTMTREGKQAQRRNTYPRKRRPNLAIKTGSKKDNLKKGYKEHENALSDNSINAYIPKIK